MSSLVAKLKKFESDWYAVMAIMMLIIIFLSLHYLYIGFRSPSLPPLEETEKVEGVLSECVKCTPRGGSHIRMKLADGRNYFLIGFIYDGFDSRRLLENVRAGDEVVLRAYTYRSGRNPRICALEVGGITYLTYEEAGAIYTDGIHKSNKEIICIILPVFSLLFIGFGAGWILTRK